MRGHAHKTMKTTERNDPCPCGSGKKYKKCCLAADELQQAENNRRIFESRAALEASVSELDDLSNSVITLIEVEDWTAAEAVCHQLQQRYPDQVDGVWRMAMVEEARGNRAAAAKAYREAAEFMRTNDGFEMESIADMIASAERMEC
jgi:hypothetical protein